MGMSNFLVITPTFNEIENIESFIDKISELNLENSSTKKLNNMKISTYYLVNQNKD